MIINTGQQTDIPAFYARWFLNRIRAGSVCVRNPYNPSQVSRYRLSPKVVDCIGFCTKNPLPLLPYLDQLQGYGQYWYVSITPYGRDLEPNVPDKHRLLQAFRQLSREVGKQAIGWRYDPILLTERYTTEYHLRAFRTMAETLAWPALRIRWSSVSWTAIPRCCRTFRSCRRYLKRCGCSWGRSS